MKVKYYCGKCKHDHKEGTKVYMDHMKFNISILGNIKPEKEKKRLHLQVMLSNGQWRDLYKGELDNITKSVIERDKWYAQRVGREPLKSKAEFLELLSHGKKFEYGSEWYDNIRLKKEPVDPKIHELSYLREQYWELDAKIMEGSEPSVPSKLYEKKRNILKKIKELKGNI